ncbi:MULTISPECIES: hypothetical protein [Bradyrhizobium]|uniref:Uncharacterized protein n=1 Tax=Bradyrhizobium yuanmingense TaxID=108015 RepID=A0ABV4GM95_9BRAD|nr:hypothetical protein [Bradyrhizobium yuanmingense]
MANINLSSQFVGQMHAPDSEPSPTENSLMESTGPETLRFPDETWNNADGADGCSNKARAPFPISTGAAQSGGSIASISESPAM